MDSEAHQSQISKTTPSKRLNVVVIFLRLLALFATASATVVMVIDKQTKTFVVGTIGTVPIQATLTAKFQHTPAFVFFVITNGLASLHNFLVLVVGFLGTKWCGFAGLVPLAITILDLMNLVVASGGVSAAAFMGQLGRDGNSHTRWNKICDKFDTFCDHAGGAMIASFFGLVIMMVISIINIVRIRNNHLYNKLVANSPNVP